MEVVVDLATLRKFMVEHSWSLARLQWRRFVQKAEMPKVCDKSSIFFPSVKRRHSVSPIGCPLNFQVDSIFA